MTSTTKCARCSGTGAYITGMLNGKPVGPGGICFRCSGKGFTTDADQRRNYGYDNFYRNVAAVEVHSTTNGRHFVKCDDCFNIALERYQEEGR